MSEKLSEIKKCEEKPVGLVTQDEPVEVTSEDERVDQKEINVIGKQWSLIEGQYIVPVSDTFEHLEPGYYSIGQNNQIGLYFVKEKVNLDKLYRMPNKATDIIMDDISKFWTLRDRYKKYHHVFKRNYLLYSAPGTGKTSLINLMCQDLITKYGGLVFGLTCESDIAAFVDVVRRVRKIDGNIPIIAVIEDIDNFIGSEHQRSSLDTQLLNILDGNYKMSDVVIIATTNYIERVQARYKNRPSRFNRVVEFPLPNAESRKMYIENTILPEDKDMFNIDEWVEKTEGYTIDHIKELIQQFFVLGETEENAFASVDAMVNNNNRLRNKDSVSQSKLGF